MQILKMHNLTQNYRINLAARGILQSHGTLRHMTDESNNGIHTVIHVPMMMHNFLNSRSARWWAGVVGDAALECPELSALTSGCPS